MNGRRALRNQHDPLWFQTLGGGGEVFRCRERGVPNWETKCPARKGKGGLPKRSELVEKDQGKGGSTLPPKLVGKKGG